MYDRGHNLWPPKFGRDLVTALKKSLWPRDESLGTSGCVRYHISEWLNDFSAVTKYEKPQRPSDLLVTLVADLSTVHMVVTIPCINSVGHSNFTLSLYLSSKVCLCSLLYWKYMHLHSWLHLHPLAMASLYNCQGVPYAQCHDFKNGIYQVQSGKQKFYTKGGVTIDLWPCILTNLPLSHSAIRLHAKLSHIYLS